MANVTNYHKASRFNPYVSLILKPRRSGIHSQSAGLRLRLRGSGAGAPGGSRRDPRLLLPGSASGLTVVLDPWLHRTASPLSFPAWPLCLPSAHLSRLTRPLEMGLSPPTKTFSLSHPWSSLWVSGNRSMGSSDEEVDIFGGCYSAHHIHFGFFKQSVLCLFGCAGPWLWHVGSPAVACEL